MLIISGTGNLPDYFCLEPNTPWKHLRDCIEWGEIADSVTDIRPYAFEFCTKLTSLKIKKPLFLITSFQQRENAPEGSVFLWHRVFADTPVGKDMAWHD